MPKIYAIGETLLDIIFRGDKPQTAKAGGSMLNSAVSLGRLSLPVSFISEYACDNVGDLIDNFLRENGVDTSHVHRYSDGKTALALAFLDEKNDAHYSFYKNYPAQRLDIDIPVFTNEDILLFGSFYAIAPEIREKYLSLIRCAKERGAILLYDPNFRKSHLDELESLKPLIVENMDMATLIRGSDEDFTNIFGAKSPEEAWDFVRRHCKCMIYTSSSDGVYVMTSSYSGKFPVKKIKPVSTIGAGDNFNAGMIFAMYTSGVTNESLSKIGETEWNIIVPAAVDFATDVCMSYENYISEEFAFKLKTEKSKQS